MLDNQSTVGDPGPLQQREKLPESGQVVVAHDCVAVRGHWRAWGRAVSHHRSGRAHLSGGEQLRRPDTSLGHGHRHQGMVLDRASNREGRSAGGRPTQANAPKNAPGYCGAEGLAVQDANIHGPIWPRPGIPSSSSGRRLDQLQPGELKPATEEGGCDCSARWAG